METATIVAIVTLGVMILFWIIDHRRKNRRISILTQKLRNCGNIYQVAQMNKCPK